MRSGSEDNKRPSPPSSTSVLDRQPEPDSDDQSCDNDADPASQTAKRKRPISVSYVDRPKTSSSLCVACYEIKPWHETLA